MYGQHARKRVKDYQWGKNVGDNVPTELQQHKENKENTKFLYNIVVSIGSHTIKRTEVNSDPL